MNHGTKLWTLALTAALVGCAADVSTEAGEAEPAARQVSAVGLQIEQAERQLDRGGDARAAVTTLRAALSDRGITAAERRVAVLALSRAHEAAGELEKAIEVIEVELAAHADDRAWEGETFKRRLRRLLTGSENTPGLALDREERVAPFAHVVAKSFPADADGVVKASFYMAGGNRDLSDELGTFNIRGALEDEQEESCPLCETRVNVSQWTRQSDWMVIPEYQGQFDQSFLVFYFDLGRNRIPERYEHHLPMKVADIVAELEQNKSFVVAKERPGAPPALLLAAPRTAMLPDVERHLAGLEHLPTTIEYAEVSTKLRPGEIRSAVRGQWFGKVRKCYESLLERDAKAQGKFVLRFTIVGEDGTLKDLEIEPEAQALTEEEFVECLRGSAQAVSFPATGKGNTTVRYPIVVTP